MVIGLVAAKVLGVGLGLLMGALTVWLVRRLKIERWGYTLSLMGLPLFYIFFALRSGDENTAFIEFFYGMLYLASGLVFAISRLKFSTYIVATLWLLHAAYDVVHGHLVMNLGVPGWYPSLCLGFDIVIAAYLFWLAGRLPEGDILKA
jgi:hypothetical protein